MKKVKKLVSLLMCFILLLSFFVSSDINVLAITTSEIQQKLQTKMTTTGYKPGYTPPSSYSKGSGCYGFVDMLCRYLYGHELPSQASNHYQFTGYSTNFTQIGSTLTISAGTLTESSLQTLFSQAKSGDVIQMDYTKYGGGDSLHTMMVYSVSSSGVVFYHAGSSKVYFGASSGTQPLWGTTGNILTWAKLKAVLKSSDDGISLYRSKSVTDTHTHTYSNSCDTTCNACGATRSVSHTYISSCDTYCNVCNYRRTTSASHSWSNNYCGSGSCTACGIGRVTFHNYSDATCTKPKTCTICGLTSGSALGHKYSNSCDQSCNECGAVRNVTHKYSNNCDSKCNICGETRIPSDHVYDNTHDTDCNICGAERIIYIFGDANGDSMVNTRDAAIVMQYANGWNVTVDLDVADVNGDEAVNTRDYALLMQYANGWHVELK